MTSSIISGLAYPDTVQRSLYSMFEYGLSRAGNESTALTYFSRTMTYSDLRDEIHACAAGLLELGVKKGDKVTICLPNIPQCVVAVYAVNRLGAVCNLVHPLSTQSEIANAVNLTESRIIFAFELNEKYAEGLGAKIIRCVTSEYFPSNPKGFVMKTVYNHSVRKEKRADSAILWRDVVRSGYEFLQRNSLPADSMTKEDTAAIMYTGGTTGDSKGVILSNQAFNVTTSALIMQKVEGRCRSNGAFLSILPVFHAFGLLVAIHAPLSCGMKMVLSPRFNPKECVSLILKEQIEVIAGVPAMYERMYPLLQGKDLSAIQHIVCGGDLVSSDLIERYNALLKSNGSKAVFLPGYGLTESGGACILVPETMNPIPEGCVGKPVNGLAMCLVEPGTTRLVDTEGELCLRGKSVMGGYYKNENATAEVLRRHADGNIWLHTGDIVSFDSEQNIIFKSRYKRMIKVNGYNVYPTIIENTMEKCGIVEEVCAVAAPWKTDKRIKLYVTLTDKTLDKERAEEEIMAFAKANLNHWSCPFAVGIIDEMPRTKMNKKDYKVLEES